MDEEIKEEILDSPLVVHKKSDASYKDATLEVDMSSTHEEEDANAPTLERHRFKKNKKKSSGGKWVFLAIIVIAVGIISAMAYSGKLPFNKEVETTTQVVTEYTTENRFEDTIVIKGTYVFVDGEEVDGIKGLESKIKYLDDNQKSFTVIDEHANNNFLNYEVLPLLETYGITYETTFKESTGLLSSVEQAALESTTAPTTQAPTVTEESTEPQE